MALPTELELERIPRARTRPRRRSRARTDWAIAAGIVLVLVVSGALGIALAGIVAVTVLGARAALLGVRAAQRRRRPTPARARAEERARAPGERRRGPSAPQRAVRILTMGALIALLVATFSFASALSGNSNSSFGIRSVEWMRDNGAQSLVSSVEAFYYTFTAPAKGGPTLKRLPAEGVAAARAGYRPADVRPVMYPRLPGEGIWRPTQRRFATRPAPVLVTTYRPDPSYPRVVAGLAWIDPRRAHIALYPGVQEPPGSGPRGSAEVPVATRSTLLATFNSGFKHADSQGGFFAGGTLFQPLVNGQGTVVGTTDGRIDVRSWTGGPRPGPGIAFARQNLPLIVSAGRPNPTLGDSSKWGTTLGNAVLVWRSGLGIDRRGNLIYAAANDQSAAGLAHILIHAGAVRAIELDINSYWISFNSYRRSAGRDPRKLLPDISRDATRYLSPDDRDFFAVYSR